MTLFTLRDYLRTPPCHRSVSDIAQYFGVCADRVEPMLLFWINKGCVHTIRKTPLCGTRCHACTVTETTYYLWSQEPQKS